MNTYTLIKPCKLPLYDVSLESAVKTFIYLNIEYKLNRLLIKDNNDEIKLVTVNYNDSNIDIEITDINKPISEESNDVLYITLNK
jgi:hypothetical protein